VTKQEIGDTSEPQNGIQEKNMDDIRTPDDSEDFEDQLEQVVFDNSVLLHALTEVLIKKGIINQEELEEELNRLYKETEALEE
jgi:hypothetical protein